MQANKTNEEVVSSHKNNNAHSVAQGQGLSTTEKQNKRNVKVKNFPGAILW